MLSMYQVFIVCFICCLWSPHATPLISYLISISYNFHYFRYPSFYVISSFSASVMESANGPDCSTQQSDEVAKVDKIEED